MNTICHFSIYTNYRKHRRIFVILEITIFQNVYIQDPRYCRHIVSIVTFIASVVSETPGRQFRVRPTSGTLRYVVCGLPRDVASRTVTL